MKMTHKNVLALLLAAFAAPMVAEQQDGDHGDVVRAAPTVTLNLLKDYVANVTGKGYNAASMNNVALYELALQGGGGSSGGTLTNSSTVGNVTLGSLVNSSTVGNVTLGSLVNSSTLGNVTLGSLVNSSTLGNVALGSLVQDASLGNATLATLIAAAYNLVFSPTAGNVTLGSLVNGATFGNVTLGSLVNNSTFGNVTLGSLVNNSTMGNATLAVILSTFASVAQTALLNANGLIPWTETVDARAIMSVTGGNTITFATAGTYMVTIQGTIEITTAAGTCAITTGGSASPQYPTAGAIVNVSSADVSTTNFAFTQIVTATATQTLTYTAAITNAEISNANLFITRLS